MTPATAYIPKPAGPSLRVKIIAVANPTKTIRILKIKVILI